MKINSFLSYIFVNNIQQEKTIKTKYGMHKFIYYNSCKNHWCPFSLYYIYSDFFSSPNVTFLVEYWSTYSNSVIPFGKFYLNCVNLLKVYNTIVCLLRLFINCQDYQHCFRTLSKTRVYTTWIKLQWTITTLCNIFFY